jgi:hypothetical protein
MNAEAVTLSKVSMVSCNLMTGGCSTIGHDRSTLFLTNAGRKISDHYLQPQRSYSAACCGVNMNVQIANRRSEIGKNSTRSKIIFEPKYKSRDKSCLAESSPTVRRRYGKFRCGTLLTLPVRHALVEEGIHPLAKVLAHVARRIKSSPSSRVSVRRVQRTNVPNAENRPIRLVGQPVTLSRTPSRMAARPPEFGEQTDEVLAEFGFSAEEIEGLRQSKVV